MQKIIHNYDFTRLAHDIKQAGKEYGFTKIGIADLNLSQTEKYYQRWIANGLHGSMDYLKNYPEKRFHPELLYPETLCIISCQIPYPSPVKPNHPIAAFAHVPDYSRLIHSQLKKYVKKIINIINCVPKVRVFSGSGPVMEKILASKAGVGWIGKNTLVINDKFGSYCFLGELFINLPLPCDAPTKNYCGNCTKCLDSCPTKAITRPHELDARRCIAYLTIEHEGPIPLELRPAIGNRIFGCDICQEACPWNQTRAKLNASVFNPATEFLHDKLSTLFLWSEEAFKVKAKGSAIGRISYENWLRNIAVALGNSAYSQENKQALEMRKNHSSELVREHVDWALMRLQNHQ
ncbi:MAG: tRNA epoxyqueuosine(34) reductase QueG [Gammaproteobacteria bacterium]|nr:tRNA epoxyqueuosine(34) reductase QueG [Gammaproteobacteria bacterium]